MNWWPRSRRPTSRILEVNEMASRAVEEAFSSTSKLLFGQALSPIDAYADWLVSDSPNWRVLKRAGKEAAVPNYGFFKYVPDERIAAFERFDEIGKRRLTVKSPPDLHTLADEMGQTLECIPDVIEGTNMDVESCTLYKNLVGAYKCLGSFHSKYIGFNSWADYNENAFGLYRTFHSKSSIRCYHSDKLSRCFEMDGCNSCSDAMFCHDCENLEHALFCFNSSSLRYAVGNVEVGKEEYGRIKKLVLEEIAQRLEKDKALSLSIYNLR